MYSDARGILDGQIPAARGRIGMRDWHGSVGRYDDAIRLAAEHELGLPASELTISRLLRDAGYGTAIVGKWHLGYEDKFAPDRHGFEYAFYAQGGGMDYFHHVENPPAFTPVLRLNGDPIQRNGSYFTELIADEATGWLRRHREIAAAKPFFLYVPFTAPHAPYQGPQDNSPLPLPAESDRWRQGKASPPVYAAMIESMDAAIGRILAEVQADPLARNTLVVFASDNGGTASARPTKLRGFKGTTFEGGIRVPCIMHWPGTLAAGTEYAHPAMIFDVTLSMARIAGIQPSRPFDGIDIVKSVAAGEMLPMRSMFWRQRRGDRIWRAVREGSLKYVSETRGDQREEFLFDLAADESEKNNLLEMLPNDARRLTALLQQWEEDVKPVR